MPSAHANFVTVEQLGVWIERREWLDQTDATRVGFARATLNEILEKHCLGAIQFSAIVDGDRALIEHASIDDYIFEITWSVRAGLFLAGSQGNCEVRGRSIQVFLPEKLADLGWRSSELVHSPTLPEGAIGYHRVVRQIRVSQQQAVTTWPFAAFPADAFRDQIVDLLLLVAGRPDFPTSSADLFDVVRAAPLLMALSNADLERFISTNFPHFWSSLEFRWEHGPEKAAKFLDHKRERPTYGYKQKDRLFYDWPAIEDDLLVELLRQGLPLSHGALAKMVQNLVLNEQAGPTRSENDRHFKRYIGFYAGTAGTRANRPAPDRKSTDAKGIRRPANMRRP
jgi:hypothetical protein